MIEPQYLYSRFTPQTVTELVMYHYDIPMINSCVFYVFGLHDNYLIETSEGKFFVRIYRAEWRTPEEIQFELDLLDYLKDNEQPVSSPLQTKQNDLSFQVTCPEGTRLGAVFSFAAGESLAHEITKYEAQLLGSCVAGMHNETKGFHSVFKRKNLDCALLVNRSLEVIKPFLTAQQKSYLTSVQKTIETNLAELTLDDSGLVVCVGDVNSTNFHLTGENKITLFDFDQCGYGQRAFEVGKFFSSIHSHSSKSEIQQAFLQGYESAYKLSTEEKLAIPFFEIASVIWVMSIRVDNVNKVGHSALESAYWRKRIGIIEELMGV